MGEIEKIEEKIDRLDEKIDSLDRMVRKIEHWRIGNGTHENSADYRLNWIMNNGITKNNIHQVVHDVVKEVMKEKNSEKRADWNKWVNTGLLILAVVGVYIQLGGG